MPEGRFVSKTISQNEQLAGVSLVADYLFGRCIPHLDRDGRMPGHPELVKSIACPMRKEIQSGVIPDLLRSLGGAGLLKWYEVEGKQILEFPGFRRHQKGMRVDREAESRYPPSDSGGARDLLRTYSGPTTDKVGVSRSISEVEVEEETDPPPQTGAGAPSPVEPIGHSTASPVLRVRPGCGR